MDEFAAGGRDGLVAGSVAGKRILTALNTLVRVSGLLVADVLRVGLGLLSAVVYARYLSQSGFGKYSFVLSVVGALGFLSLNGMNVAIMQAAAHRDESFLRTATRARLKFALLGTIAVAAFGAVAGATWGRDVAVVFFAGAILFPACFSLDGYTSLLAGSERHGKLSAYRIWAVAVPSLATTLAALVFREWTYVAVVNFLSTSAVHLVLYAKTVRSARSSDADDSGALLSYGRHVSALNALSTGRYYLDRILVGVLVSFGALAQFSIARLIAEEMKALWVAVHAVVFPKIAARSRREARRQLNAQTGIVLTLFVVVGLLAVAALPYLLPWLFGSRYRGALPYAQVLVASVVVAIPGTMCETYYSAQRMVKELTAYRTASSAVYILLLVVLTIRHGAMGAAVAQLASAAVVSVLAYGYVIVRPLGVLPPSGAVYPEEGAYRCPACGDKSSPDRFTAADELLSSGRRFEVLRCRGCGSLATKELDDPVVSKQTSDYPEGYHARRPSRQTASRSNGMKNVLRRRLYAVRTALYERYYQGRSDGHHPRLKDALGILLCSRWLRSSILSFPSHRKFLDLGCGGGAFAGDMRAIGNRCFGVDIVPEATRICLAQGVPVARGSADTLPFRSGAFDVVTAWEVIEHLDDADSALKEMRRVLRKDGALVLSTPNAGAASRHVFGRYWENLDPPRHRVIYSPDALLAVLDRAGFDVVRLEFQSSGRGILRSLGNVLRAHGFPGLDPRSLERSLAMRLAASAAARVTEWAQVGSGMRVYATKNGGQSGRA